MGVMVLKGLSVYEIRDMALKSGRSVFSPQQLSNLIGRPKPVATVYMNRLVVRGEGGAVQQPAGKYQAEVLQDAFLRGIVCQGCKGQARNHPKLIASSFTSVSILICRYIFKYFG